MPQPLLQRAPAPRLQAEDAFLHSATDEEFDQVFPPAVGRQSVRHWSPVQVCRAAARFLVVAAGTRVLDIGCGPGKFCLVGACTTQGHFTGVEQRASLAWLAQDVVSTLHVPRVNIVRGNIQDVDFRGHDAFYLFNPFQENIMPSLRIDDDVATTPQLYVNYTTHVREQLTRMPGGTRIATYCGNCEEIPARLYTCVDTAFDETLKLWVKN